MIYHYRVIGAKILTRHGVATAEPTVVSNRYKYITRQEAELVLVMLYTANDAPLDLFYGVLKDNNVQCSC